MEQRTLTEKQAYAAMLLYLDAYYERGKSEEIIRMMAGMRFLLDGMTADPAAWYDWEQAVGKVLAAAESKEKWDQFEQEHLIEYLANPDQKEIGQ